MGVIEGLNAKIVVLKDKLMVLEQQNEVLKEKVVLIVEVEDRI